MNEYSITEALNGKRIGFALCGSFCTFEKAFSAMEELKKSGAELTPIMSFNAAAIDTRFGKAADHIVHLEELCGRKVIRTIEDAEPIGPKKMFDLLICAPCTGNTLAKLSCGITDTAVIVKRKPVLCVLVFIFSKLFSKLDLSVF